MAAVTAADHELAARPIEVHSLHCEKVVEVREDDAVSVSLQPWVYCSGRITSVFSSAKSHQQEQSIITYGWFNYS